jgi:NhaA family Na+:H+ antiporter
LDSTPQPPGNGDQAVTVSIVRDVYPGREREYEELLDEILDQARTIPGYRSSRTIRPPRGNQQFRVIIWFDSEQNLQEWVTSEKRQGFMERMAELADDQPMVSNITGTAQDSPLALSLPPLESFVRTSVSGIGMLLLGTVVALILANSPLSEEYEAFWNATFTIGTDSFGISTSLRHWVNDALMALFFFMVGLEIKREVLVGELRYPRQATLAIAAALGGVTVPGLIFLAINWGGAGQHGWGVPIGTDTAFALGLITLLGTRVRPALLVFLTAFAIIDDIMAVGVIAIFYTNEFNWWAAGIALVFIGALVIANRAGLHRWPIYAVLGVGVWIAVYQSGVHATAAGVLVALTIPARSWINPSEFLIRSRKLIDDFERACGIAPTTLTNEPQQLATEGLARLVDQVETPLSYFEHRINPWVAYGILPIFALANAGIPLVNGLGEALTNPVSWGVIIGLTVGKPVGILTFAWLAVRIGIARLPRAISWRQIFGVGALGGVGFTMSLFITELAFHDANLANASRIGILIGSVVAATMGFLILRAVLPPPREELEG